ncbi:unnamed protein product [Mycena citricolor]|uniref:Methyltransferase domain-containing protein n=1 Tax=Mycena citricolor TaxID=2018698 RepID=A0AAD2H8B0_9AGAR|nr:unnamed protein product [Mycena citricolor]
MSDTETFDDVSSDLEEVEDFPSYFVQRNSRLFHAHDSSPYPLPVDTPENERSDTLHFLLYRHMGNRHYPASCPVGDLLARSPSRQKRVLDLCTGTGRWALDMAARFPDSQVRALDIVPIQTRYPPSNVQFFIQDVNALSDAIWDDATFDLIHARSVTMAVTSYPDVIAQVARLLRPGGIFLSGEWGLLPAFNPDRSHIPVPAMDRFFELVHTCLSQRGLPEVAPSVGPMLAASGAFGDITPEEHYLPLGTWHPDTALHESGMAMRGAFSRFMDSVRMMILDSVIEITEDELAALYERVKRELLVTDGLATVFHTVYARKLGQSALNRVTEEPAEEWRLDDDEEELEAQGYYIGSYKRLLALYTLTPITAVVFFGLLAVLPYAAYSPHAHPHTYPYPSSLPFPAPELLLSIALYCLAHVLRAPIYALCTALAQGPLPATLLSTLFHALISIAARRTALSLLLVRHFAEFAHPTWRDPAFLRVWWAALGWAAAEAAVSVHQGYAGLALYEDVLVYSAAAAAAASPSGTDPENTPLLPARPPSDPDTELDRDMDQLISLKAREELEDVLGLPLIRIPPFIPCLQRVNSLLLSIGLSLLLGGSLYGTTWHGVALSALAVGTHLLVAVLYAPFVLPRVGVQTAAYVGIVVSLGAFFAGLGVWGGVS